MRSFEFSKDEQGQRDVEGEEEQKKIINNCVKQISSVIEIFERDEHLTVKRGESRMSIQIIPNVKRIKLEKNIYQKNLAKLKKNEHL